MPRPQHEPSCAYAKWNAETGMRVGRPPACTCLDVLRARVAELEAALQSAVTDIGKIGQEVRHHYSTIQACGAFSLYSLIDECENRTDGYVAVLRGEEEER